MDGITVSIFSFALSLLLNSVANYVAWRATRIGALKIWALSNLVGLGGICLFIIFKFNGWPSLILLQNLLYFISLALVPAGLYRYRSLKFPFGMHLIIITLALGIVGFAIWLHESFALRTLISSAMFAGYCFYIAYLIQQQTRGKSALLLFALGSWGLYGLVNIIRVFMVFLGVGIDDGHQFHGTVDLLVFLLSTICTTGGYVGLILLIVQRLIDEKQSALVVAERLAAQYRELSDHDPLTNAFNSRKFMEQLALAFRECRENKSTLSVLMADLDLFKRVNDTYGHAIGDAVLKRAVDIWQTLLRSPDRLGRVGGEEFAIILPGADAAEAIQVAERLRAGLAATTMDIAESITASFGVAEAALSAETAEQLLRRADDAMYAAKRSGRNRVSLSAPA